MTRRDEGQFWVWFKGKIPNGHLQRVENSIERGTPDVNACVDGSHVWIELKVEEGGMIKIRKEQGVWAFRRKRAGGRVVCIADMHNGTIAAWDMPCETRVINDTFQQIVQLPDRVVIEECVDHLIGWIFRKHSD